MDSTSLCSSSVTPCPFSNTSKVHHHRHNTKRVSMKISASRRGAHEQNYSGGSLVDANMIVLRKRIHEMKMVERNYEPPADWMDWEKRYYTIYDSLICEIVGILQCYLMDSRPSLALGFTGLIMLSVPTSTVIVFFHLMEISKGLLAGIHVV